MLPKDSIYTDMTHSENQVAEFLKELDLWWVYEFLVFVHDEKKRPRVWTKDFYLPELKLHLEICGSKNFDYSYRDKIYQNNDVSVIFYICIRIKKNGKVGFVSIYLKLKILVI